MYKISDKFSFDISGKNLTPEGYLDVGAKISRSGIYQYFAYELGDLFDDRDPFSVINVYRPEDEVFKPSSMASFSLKPITDDHPWQNVTAENVRDVQMGISGPEFIRVGDFVAGRLLIQDAGAVNRVQRQEVELSAGYQCNITRESGLFNGEQYEAVQTDIQGNHIAMVDAGRCGANCKISDRLPSGSKPMKPNDCSCKGNNMSGNNEQTLSTITLDGITVRADANAVSLFDRMGNKVKEHEQTIASKDAEIDALKASHATVVSDKDKEIQSLKDAAIDETKIDDLVADRLSLIDTAKKIKPDIVYDGKTNIQIKKEAVAHKMGDAAVKDKDDNFFNVSFEVFASTEVSGGGVDPIASSLNDGNGGSSNSSLRDKAIADRNKRLEESYQA